MYYLNAKSRLYIVVSVNENGDDIPVALDIKQVGETKQCCQPDHCGTLRGHLSTVWPNRLIESTHKRHNPDEDSDIILGPAFDNGDLTEFTHSLCLKCSPMP